MARPDVRRVFAVERACDVLGAICANVGQPQGIKDISDALQVNASTVHRVLAAFVHKGLVRQDPVTRKYLAGPWLLEVALAYLRGLDLPQLAQPCMNRLRDETGETATLSMRDGAWRIYLLQVESRQEIRQTVEIGRRCPLHLGGSGKAMLAFLPPQERDAYLAAKELADSAGGPVDIAALRDELARVRRRGYANSRSERLPGAASVAAPIRDYRGSVIGCLSISGPVWRFDDECVERYGKLVVAAARQVSLSLGAPDASAADGGARRTGLRAGKDIG